MLSITLIKINNFREWTHGVNENEILFVQHSIYSFLTQKLGNIGAFVFPAFYDNLIVVTNTIDIVEFEKIITETENKFHFQLTTLHSTQKNAYECLEQDNLKDSKVAPLNFSTDNVVMLHFDVDSYLSKKKSLYDISTYLSDVLKEIRELYKEFVGYLVSGDNFVFVGSEFDEVTVRNRFQELSRKFPMKLGVGVSRYSGRAATLSAIALDEIRTKRGDKEAFIEQSEKMNVKHDDNVSVYINEIDIFEKSSVLNYLLMDTMTKKQKK